MPLSWEHYVDTIPSIPVCLLVKRGHYLLTTNNHNETIQTRKIIHYHLVYTQLLNCANYSNEYIFPVWFRILNRTGYPVSVVPFRLLEFINFLSFMNLTVVENIPFIFHSLLIGAMWEEFLRKSYHLFQMQYPFLIKFRPINSSTIHDLCQNYTQSESCQMVVFYFGLSFYIHYLAF